MRDAFIWRLPPGGGCALTFDDGPNGKFTPQVLDLLASLGVSASFFLVGQAVLRNPAIARRIVEEGHAVGSHTFSHREFPGLSAQELADELYQGQAAIRDVVGIDTAIVRPPRGRVDIKSMWRAKRLGFRIVHWSKTYSDYQQDGREPLVARMRSRGLEAGDIVLLHDNNPYTIEALGDALPEWLAEGKRFVTLL